MNNASMIFDTETTGLDKPFCYDIGYAIYDEHWNVLALRHFIIEQVWHNLPLFESAYYRDKRPQYVLLMRQHKAIMDKYGYVMRQIAKDIRDYGVVCAYAYNSDFDEKVFNFNCDWYKCCNPLETIPVHDIWGYASQFITNDEHYSQFCEDGKYFTDSGNYSASAENVYRYISGQNDFVEKHMGLDDVMIEAEILKKCIAFGAKPDTDYKVVKVLKREHETPYTVKVNGAVIHSGTYLKKYVRNETYSFTE